MASVIQPVGPACRSVGLSLDFCQAPPLHVIVCLASPSRLPARDFITFILRRPPEHLKLGMALPSSPPLIPEELTSSPPSLSIASLNVFAGTADRPTSRKRHISDYSSLSSDPLFSEDASEVESGTDGAQPKRKRVVRGPWWNHPRAKGPGLRQSMAKKDKMRNADSGVWMGSDGSNDSIDSVGSSQSKMQKLDVYDEGMETEEDEIMAVMRVSPEVVAARLIQKCLDNGNETVDISELGLGHVPNDTLKPLHQLIRQTHSSFAEPPSEDEFGPFTPSLQLYLSGNKLASLPAELFNLENITVLSLRKNNLSRLPSGISRLRNLRELNISGNQITYLPAELLELMKDTSSNKQFTIRPNPLQEPCDFDVPHVPQVVGFDDYRAMTFDHHDIESRRRYIHGRRNELRRANWLSVNAELHLRLMFARARCNDKALKALKGEVHRLRDQKLLVCLASSSVVHRTMDGSLCDRTPLSYRATLDSEIDTPTRRGRNSVPSLLELALRSVQSTYDLGELAISLPDDVPMTVQKHLDTASNATTDGGNDCCSTCGRAFLIARAEWMEYWACTESGGWRLTPDDILPFLRRVCSWACVNLPEVGTYF